MRMTCVKYSIDFGLYINLNKCEFSTTKIAILYHMVEVNSVKMNQTKIKIINE
jgi:hypothetical protein